MLLKLIILFSIVPLVELALLIEIGQRVGVIFTVVLVATTGAIGVSLARNQGFKVIGHIKNRVNQGRLPAEDLISGLLILAGGLFLLTPGLLTDISGFLLIIPFTRSFFVKVVKSKCARYINKNFRDSPFRFHTGFGKNESRESQFDKATGKEKNNASEGEQNIIDVDFEEVEEQKEPQNGSSES